ncbi:MULTISPECIES: virulence RhuM family protein [unclassified Endozoicomonas]|uniref:virulence RhuM family protein n=1 Tax=unclassified Endozoicomonas TaxID=2644528 RepID=UPI002148F826|nr:MULTISPECIES: RhuM family protein [unclassified Endozoicomonas]
MNSDSNEVQIFTTDSGSIHVQLAQKSVWLTQRQMGEVFGTTAENILMHLKNIYKNQELEEKLTSKDFLVVQKEGKRQVRRNLKHYDLDVIISVGYRVNSKRAVQFRRWATGVLNNHLTHGFSINQQRFEENAKELEAALVLIRKAAATPELEAEAGRGLVEIVSRYTQTFLWLQRYDEGLLSEPAGQPGGTLVDKYQAMTSLNELKRQLIQRGEATELFAKCIAMVAL